MGACRPDFLGRFSDTTGFFFDMNEYESRKDAAILKLTSEDESPANKVRNAMNAKMEDLKEKYKESINKYKSQMNSMKSQMSEFTRETKKAITKDRNATKLKVRDEYKDRVVKAEGKYHKTLISLYDFIKEQRANLRNEEFSVNLYSTFLRHNKIDKVTAITLNKMLDDGKFQKELWRE